MNHSFSVDSYCLFDPCAYIDAKYESITLHIDTVIGIVKRRFPNANLYCLSIPVRTNWYPLTIALAKMVDKYIGIEHEV